MANTNNLAWQPTGNINVDRFGYQVTQNVNAATKQISAVQSLASTSALGNTVQTGNLAGVVTFDASKGSILWMTLIGSVTASSVIKATTGQILTIGLYEKGGGGFTFAWPTTFSGTGALNTAAGKTNVQLFLCLGSTFSAITALVNY